METHALPDPVPSLYDRMVARLIACGYHVAWRTTFALGTGEMVLECWLTYELSREPGHVIVQRFPDGGIDVLRCLGDAELQSLGL
jgi:hypothetical protein